MPEWHAGSIKAHPIGRNRATVGTAFDFMLAAILYKAKIRIDCIPRVERTGMIPFDRLARQNERVIYGGSPDALAVARSCVVLAKLHDSANRWNRSGRHGCPAYSFRPMKAEVLDVYSIGMHVRPATFRPLGRLKMQVRLGRGAVCDILASAGPTIIDVKTAAHGELTRLQFDQCLAYAAMSNLDVYRVGIYFARHGRLFLHDVHVRDGPGRERFKALLSKRAIGS